MKTKLLLPFLAVMLLACQAKTESENPIVEKASQPDSTELLPKVTGIGGIFFKSNDPEKTKAWYRDNLGLAVGPNGAPFEFRNAHRPDEINYLNWDAFPDSTDYFDPSEKEFMINYRVQNIEGLVEILKENGVTIVDEITAFPFGKFVHIVVLYGYKFDLWEPIDSFLTELGGETTK